VQATRARRAGLFCLSLAAIFTALWGWVPRAYAEDEPAADVSASHHAPGHANNAGGNNQGGGANNPAGPFDNTAGQTDNNGNSSTTPNQNKPQDGTVGNADNKNPPGQVNNGKDNGYECDGNKGVGQGNPAHTTCTTTPPCDPAAQDCDPCDPATEDCDPCDPATEDCDPCDPATEDCDPCDPATENCGPCVSNCGGNNCANPPCGNQQQLETQVLNNVIVRGPAPGPGAAPAVNAVVDTPAAEVAPVVAGVQLDRPAAQAAAAAAAAAAQPKPAVLGVQLAKTGGPTEMLLTMAGIFLCLGATLMLLSYKRQVQTLAE
jgi:hypothetical protein